MAELKANPEAKADHNIEPKHAEGETKSESTTINQNPKPLSFGVELEFAVCYIPRGVSNPDPSEKRKVNFPDPSDYPADHKGSDGRSPIDIEGIIQLDIIQTLVNHGFEARFKNYEGQEDDVPPKEWWLLSDNTITVPEDHPAILMGYEFARIEITSLALYFSDSSVKQVEAGLRCLEEKYFVLTNTSTGLHVHVGRGTDGFSLEHMRNFIATLWAFEHQLSTIHPQSRIENDYQYQSMRKQSHYAKKKPLGDKPIDGMNYFLGLTDIQELLHDATCVRRQGEYNFANMTPTTNSKPIRKTIEFRGHEATFDTERVRNWILTVVGIVNWVGTASDFDMETLKLLARTETWEKIGNQRDVLNKRERGPIIAEAISQSSIC